MNVIKTGVELIAQERQEQIGKHNRTIQTDYQQNNHYQLSEAAGLLCYLDEGTLGCNPEEMGPPCDWNQEIWLKLVNKPYKERLIIAGALLAAEIDRLNYLESMQPEKTDHGKGG